MRLWIKALSKLPLPLRSSRRQDERGLLEAKLNGTEEEYLLNKQIEDIPQSVDGFAGRRSKRRPGNALRERVEQQKELDALFNSIGSSIENGILNSITTGLEALTGGVEDLDDALKRSPDTLRQIGQALIKYGLGNIGGPGVGIGQLFGNLFKAEGVSVSAGKPYIVGEQGPELMVPSSSGTVVDTRHNRSGAEPL